MKINYLCSSMVIVWLLAGWAHAQEPLLAFPGAEGFGQLAKGGRGGAVIEVTNLNGTGPGSLRDALSAAGPRTIVFRVGGTVDLIDDITITEPFLTVAGQTAPGDGVQLKGGWLVIQASDIIIRYLRSRPGLTAPDPENNDALQIIRNVGGPKVSDVILDHVSLSWATDEVFSTWGTASQVLNITVQWSIIAEGFHCANPPHSERCHSKGPITRRRIFSRHFSP